MVTQIEPLTFQYSHTIGRQETRGGNGFFHPVAVARGEGNRLYVLSRGTETPVFWPCKRVTICTIEEEYIGQFGEKIPPEEAVPSAPDGTFFWPTSIALDKQGNAYVADEWLNRISVFTKDGDWIGKWGMPGERDGELNRPSGLASGADDNLYLVDSRNNRIQVFTKEGKFLFKWGGSGSGDGEFSIPWGIDIDKNGDVYVADWRNDRIQRFAPDGRFLMKFGASGQGDGEFNRPTGVAVDKDGTIYVTDFKNDRLQVFGADGDFITKLAGEATLSKWGRERVELDPVMLKGRERAQGLEEREMPFQGPIAVDVDDENWVFVVECARHRLQVFRKQSAIFYGGPV
jgi:DNA-binding beta-propeller fold protein YncE